MSEIVGCPKCERKLQVPVQYLGQQVQCPECQHQFTATATTLSEQPMPARPGAGSSGSPRRHKDDEDDEDNYDLRRPRRDSFDDDYDEISDWRRGRRRFYPPHRGGMVLALGLVALIGGLSFFGLPLLLGPVAWALGSIDLRQMREGRMDPDGAGMTQAGQVCGIIATVLLFLGFMCIGCVVVSRIR
jgi:hypothetical protein